jgi:hypothetical protein
MPVTERSDPRREASAFIRGYCFSAARHYHCFGASAP